MSFLFLTDSSALNYIFGNCCMPHMAEHHLVCRCKMKERMVNLITPEKCFFTLKIIR